MFLRLRASADFFTLNKTMMDNPPLVPIDLSKTGSS